MTAIALAFVLALMGKLTSEFVTVALAAVAAFTASNAFVSAKGKAE